MQEIRRAVVADLEGGLEISPASEAASVCTHPSLFNMVLLVQVFNVSKQR